eukprot:EG_transcript_25536
MVVFGNLLQWWAPAIMLAVSVAAVLASCFVGAVRRHSHVVQPLLACFLVGLQCYIGWKEAQMSSMMDLEQFSLLQCQPAEPCLGQLNVLSDVVLDNHEYIAFVGILPQVDSKAKGSGAEYFHLHRGSSFSNVTSRAFIFRI